MIHGTLPPNEERLSCTIRDNHGICTEWDMRGDAPHTMKSNMWLPVGWLTIEAVGKKGTVFEYDGSSWTETQTVEEDELKESVITLHPTQQ